jgi:hypothetical protein
VVVLQLATALFMAQHLLFEQLTLEFSRYTVTHLRKWDYPISHVLKNLSDKNLGSKSIL